MNDKRKRPPLKRKDADAARAKPTRRNYKSIRFKQVVGKTIASFEQIIMDEEGGWTLEIYFTDGTVMLLELSAKLTIQAQFLKHENGHLKAQRKP